MKMKQIYLAVLAILFATTSASAQELKVDDIEATAGETVSFTLQLDCAGGSYTGMEFDTQFPNGYFTTTRQATTVEGWDGAFAIGDVGVFGEYLSRSGVLSYSSTPIPGIGMNDLGSVEIKVDTNTPLGEYDVTITSVTLIGDERVPVADASFKIKVVERHTVVLDETSTTMPNAATDVIAVVKRTINAGSWSTICLPFAMTEEQCKEAFGEGVKIADFMGTESEYDDDDNVVGIKANFQSVTSMEDNHPYIIKVEENVTEFTINGVDIDPDEGACIEFDNHKTGARRIVYSGFYGTYVANTLLDEFTLFLSGNKFYYSAGKTKMKAFRAFFDFLDILTDVEDNAGAKIAFLVDNTPASIEGLATNGSISNGAVYTVGGQLIGRNVDERQLKKGVYIRDGKKFVVK